MILVFITAVTPVTPERKPVQASDQSEGRELSQEPVGYAQLEKIWASHLWGAWVVVEPELTTEALLTVVIVQCLLFCYPSKTVQWKLGVPNYVRST